VSDLEIEKLERKYEYERRKKAEEQYDIINQAYQQLLDNLSIFEAEEINPTVDYFHLLGRHQDAERIKERWIELFSQRIKEAPFISSDANQQSKEPTK
jgi:hypothetical protein